MLTLEMIQDAKKTLEGVARVTPLYESAFINPNANVFIKCENMQVTGSFKLRGAYVKTASLTEEEASKGVIACSAGNHAQGVALAAQKKGIKATICMPAGAPLAKVEATKSYGAEVVLVPGVYDDAAAKAVELQQEKGYTFLHPFNDEYVMAGQGTVACAIKSINPNCKVYGVQAAGAPSMKQSIEHKKIEKLASVSTMADGIAVKEPGTLTFEACMKYVDGIVTVTEAEIASAILMLLEKHKMVAEGAGAVSVAAAMTNKVDIKGKNVVCVVSGGNVDVNVLDRIIDKGLQENGRIAEFSVMMADKPGQLIQIIAQTGANILDVNHDRRAKGVAVSNVVVNVTVETRNKAHYEEMVAALKAQGYTI